MLSPLFIILLIYCIISEIIGIIDLICIIRYHIDKKYAKKKPELWLDYKVQETFLFTSLIWLPIKIITVIRSWFIDY